VRHVRLAYLRAHSFFKDAPHVSFAVQDTDNVDGVCLQSVISESLQIQQPAMIEDFEFADCWKNIADPHEDFGLMTIY
jgi:hypothetical protein